MAEQNPIKYSDLISPDDSIEKLIAQLERLSEVYTGLAESVKSEAASMAASLKSVSGATEEGRKSTRGASQEADRLTKAYRDLSYARSETARRVAELKEQQKQEQQITKLNVQLQNSAAGSYNALSAQYRLNKIALNNLTAEERANLPYAKKLEEETKNIYEEMKRLQEATGKFSLNVGNYENAITSAIGIQSKWYKGIQQLGAMFEGGFSSGVKAAGTAVAGFGKQLLALLANPIVATIAAITAAFMALAKGISSSEENTNTFMRILAPFERILTGVMNVLQNVTTWILKAVEGFENLAMGASRLMEKLPLVGGAFKKVNDALAENIALTKAKQDLDKAERDNSVTQATLARNVAKWRRDAEKTNDPKRRLQLLKMANAAEERMMYEEMALAKENLRIAEAKAAQSQNDKKTNDELAAARVRVMKAEENYYQRTTRLQSKMRNISNSMNKGGGAGSGKSASETAKDESKKELAIIRAAEDAKIQLMENEYDRQRAQTIVQYDRRIEDLKTQLATETTLTVEAKKALNDQIAYLEELKYKKLADISDKEMQAAVDAENRDAQQRIKAAEGLIEKETKKKGRKDIYDILGFKLNDEEKQAIDESLAYAMEGLNTFMDAWVEAANRKRELADAEVDRARRVLDAELEARANGYANEVETARKELDMAKKNQQKAIEEQRKAQKAQEAIQAVQQMTNLVSASALIWSQLGFPRAIPAIAVMWASFAAAKIKAAQVAGVGDEEYGEGTVELLEGGSHQSGNDVDLGRKKDGTRRRAEGGEYFAVINKRNSRKYRNLIPSVINALNDGTFAEKYGGAYDSGNITVTQEMQSKDLSRMANDISVIREQGEKRSYVDGNGNTVQSYKNLRRLIRR